MNNYRELEDKINYIMNYYLDWQDYIERFSFPRIDYYYLIKNISIIYESIKKAKNYLDKDIEKAQTFIPPKIDFNNKTYQNTVSIKYVLDNIENLLEKEKENQETDEDELKKQNKDI